MARSTFLFIAHYVGGGILAYAAPRLLVVAGVPLDRWIVAVGGILAIRMNRQVALWGATVIIGAALYGSSFFLSSQILPPNTPPAIPPNQSPHTAPVRLPSPTVARQYTSRTAQELEAIYIGRTPLQAETLIQDDEGKWLKVRGQYVTAWKANSEGESGVIIRDGSASIQCAFGSEWSAQIRKLNPGDTISAEGQFIGAAANGSPLYVTSCELPGK
jgi:hypothetical protein